MARRSEARATTGYAQVLPARDPKVSRMNGAPFHPNPLSILRAYKAGGMTSVLSVYPHIKAVLGREPSASELLTYLAEIIPHES